MKAIEILNEVFDSNVQGRMTKRTATMFQTEADIGGRKIVFSAVDNGQYWEVQFTEKSSKGTTFSKTGSGNEMQVFSFVLESLKLFGSLYNPEEIQFTSDQSDGNRTSLYKRIFKRMPGYTMEVIPGSGTDTFRFVRQNP